MPSPSSRILSLRISSRVLQYQMMASLVISSSILHQIRPSWCRWTRLHKKIPAVKSPMLVESKSRNVTFPSRVVPMNGMDWATKREYKGHSKRFWWFEGDLHGESRVRNWPRPKHTHPPLNLLIHS
ncbi:hypothetical protein KC19_3G185500 [Ceratodon purpureus]|uniref:Uncharacterized protein n=1 Tax=Ceratodon purpureus TaxID=3225 RepID=A0A8T0INF7_CERPU|nr:hypothetical protein KC19_3G185500 [Ceratodon purpureus]